jgi:hypothetical protein
MHDLVCLLPVSVVEAKKSVGKVKVKGRRRVRTLDTSDSDAAILSPVLPAVLKADARLVPSLSSNSVTSKPTPIPLAHSVVASCSLIQSSVSSTSLVNSSVARPSLVGSSVAPPTKGQQATFSLAADFMEFSDDEEFSESILGNSKVVSSTEMIHTNTTTSSTIAVPAARSCSETLSFPMPRITTAASNSDTSVVKTEFNNNRSALSVGSETAAVVTPSSHKLAIFIDTKEIASAQVYKIGKVGFLSLLNGF